MPIETASFAPHGRPFDSIRNAPSSFEAHGQLFHESLLRSWRVLDLVEEMLGRGDSSTTVLAIVRMLRDAPDDKPFRTEDVVFRGVRLAIERGDRAESGSAPRPSCYCGCGWRPAQAADREDVRRAAEGRRVLG